MTSKAGEEATARETKEGDRNGDAKRGGGEDGRG